MLGVPAQVAGCKQIILATPPRPDGSISPEVMYVAKLIGASAILRAGGAQAVAALAYGTETVPKVDKIFGPGNQFVTAGKMVVSNDTTANVSIDMPAGPSEVLVIADKTANPAFVASDLLSQAEHGTDSQVVCIAVGLNDNELQAIEDELEWAWIDNCKLLDATLNQTNRMKHGFKLTVLKAALTKHPARSCLKLSIPCSVGTSLRRSATCISRMSTLRMSGMRMA